MTFLSEESRWFSINKRPEVRFETLYHMYVSSDKVSQEDFQLIYDLNIDESYWIDPNTEFKRIK